MTQAVCFKCGEMKHGVFTKCSHCGERPVTDDELVLSLAMTDHYFDSTTIKQMGAAVAGGKPPNLDEKSRQDLLKQLENARKTPVGRLLGGGILVPQKKKANGGPSKKVDVWNSF
jgi:hypothetical protein